MDCRANSDLLFLNDEKFDFDVSLSPASSKGDEEDDEVFMGPISHKERCVSVNVVSQLEDVGGGGGGVRTSWSPLSEEQLEAVCQEAHKLAEQLQCSRDPSQSQSDDANTADGDDFVQDNESKVGVFNQPASALSPIKRQTFCVQDSPMKQLPPAFQHRLLRGSSSNTAPSSRPASTAPSNRRTSGNTTPSSRPSALTRRSISSPMVGVKPQSRAGLRGKATLSVNVVLPSKPAAPTTTSSSSRSRVEKPRIQPPSKVAGGLRQSSSSRPSSRAESCEDLLSDSASITSDISDSSFNSSLLGKHTLAPPTKSALRNLSGVKGPSLQGGRKVTERRNTSSSSSSVSSFNSSLSLSPAKGKLNSSLNRSQSSSNGPAPSSISRPTNYSKPRRSTAAEPASSTNGRRSISTQARKLSEVERVKAMRSTPLKRAEATPLQMTPAKKFMERTMSMPSSATTRLQSGLKNKSKPEALVLPTPSGGVRQADAPGVSKMVKPKRLSSVDSLPQKPSAAPLTPSVGSCRSLQTKTRRPSALPTPVRHRMLSTIPVATPTRLPAASDPGSALAKRERACSPAPPDTQEAELVVPVIQPFCLEEEEHPAVPPTTPPQPDQSDSTDPEAPSHEEPEPIKDLIELETKEESSNKAQEVLLLDLPAPALQPQEKLLIDLTNTPNLIRTSNKSGTATQLIDLSSPLIKWSPEDKRENGAPLINLSF